MWEYRERWDRDEVSHEAKDMALDAYVKAGLGLALIPNIWYMYEYLLESHSFAKMFMMPTACKG
jgi:hypothetical protein